MPRVNLAITQELYDQIEKAAKKENVTVNYYICDMLEERFGKRTVYDYTLAINNMIAEAKIGCGVYVCCLCRSHASCNTRCNLGEIRKD